MRKLIYGEDKGIFIEWGNIKGIWIFIIIWKKMGEKRKKILWRN